MDDWKLPPIPKRGVSTEKVVEDELARPEDYARARRWINQTFELRDKGQNHQALSLLQKAADLCPYEFVWMLIGDVYEELEDRRSAKHAYRIGAAYGDKACEERLRGLKAQEKSETTEGLISDGSPEALEKIRKQLIAPKKAVLHWAEYRDIAKKVNRLKTANAGDVAWALLNRALLEAARAQAPLYTIYSEMGKQVYREEKYLTAMQLYLKAFLDAGESSPKYIRKNLERCFDKVDKGDSVSLERCLKLARSKGVEAAMRYLGEGEKTGILAQLFRR